MSDATHGLPIHTPDPDFGRSYGWQGDTVPEVSLPRGWWLVPLFLCGVATWVLLARALFF